MAVEIAKGMSGPALSLLLKLGFENQTLMSKMVTRMLVAANSDYLQRVYLRSRPSVVSSATSFTSWS